MQEPLNEILSLKHVWISLSKTALKDNKITKEEYIMIHDFAIQIENYKELLEKILEDGIIDGSERFQLFNAKYNILIDTLKQVNTDNRLSRDEFVLLGKIKEFLNLIEKMENDQ